MPVKRVKNRRGVEPRLRTSESREAGSPTVLAEGVNGIEDRTPNPHRHGKFKCSDQPREERKRWPSHRLEAGGGARSASNFIPA